MENVNDVHIDSSPAVLILRVRISCSSVLGYGWPFPANTIVAFFFITIVVGFKL